MVVEKVPYLLNQPATSWSRSELGAKIKCTFEKQFCESEFRAEIDVIIDPYDVVSADDVREVQQVVPLNKQSPL